MIAPKRQPIKVKRAPRKRLREHKHKAAKPANPSQPRIAKVAVRRPRKQRPTTSLPTTVLIDDRAGSRDLIKYPPFNDESCAHLARLGSADICFTGNGPDGKVNVGVELKSIMDLVSSMDNGRVAATQLPAMLDEYDVVWLLVYGRIRQAPSSNQLQVWRAGAFRNCNLGTRPIPYAMLTGFLMSLNEVGVNYMQVEDMRDAAGWLEELVKWRSKPYGKHKSLRAFDQSRKVTGQEKRKNRVVLMPKLAENIKLRARVANALPTLGYQRAVAAAHQWTVRQMVNASAEEWAGLETVDVATGKKKRLGSSAGAAVAGVMDW